jgi:hypothetical protein
LGATALRAFCVNFQLLGQMAIAAGDNRFPATVPAQQQLFEEKWVYSQPALELGITRPGARAN